MSDGLCQRPYGGQVHVDRVHGCSKHNGRTVGMVISRDECEELIKSIRNLTSQKSVQFVAFTLFVKMRDKMRDKMCDDPKPHMTITQRPNGRR